MNLIHLDDIGISSFFLVSQQKKKKKKKAKSMIVWEDGSHLSCSFIQTYQHSVPRGLTAPQLRSGSVFTAQASTVIIASDLTPTVFCSSSS